MKIAVATLESISPYSPSRRTPEKLPKEQGDEYENRVWRERAHVTDDGHVFIPPMAFKRSLEASARFLRMRIPGKDRSEYGKHFAAGVLVVEGLVLPIKKEEMEGEWLYLSGSGKKGEMSVLKCEPLIRVWKGEVTYHVLDDTISQDVFERHLKEAGNFIGIGRFRPEMGGYYGRYKIASIAWE